MRGKGMWSVMKAAFWQFTVGSQVVPINSRQLLDQLLTSGCNELSAQSQRAWVPGQSHNHASPNVQIIKLSQHGESGVKSKHMEVQCRLLMDLQHILQTTGRIDKAPWEQQDLGTVHCFHHCRDFHAMWGVSSYLNSINYLQSLVQKAIVKKIVIIISDAFGLCFKTLPYFILLHLLSSYHTSPVPCKCLDFFLPFSGFFGVFCLSIWLGFQMRTIQKQLKDAGITKSL